MGCDGGSNKDCFIHNLSYLLGNIYEIDFLSSRWLSLQGIKEAFSELLVISVMYNGSVTGMRELVDGCWLWNLYLNES